MLSYQLSFPISVPVPPAWDGVARPELDEDEDCPLSKAFISTPFTRQTIWHLAITPAVRQHAIQPPARPPARTTSGAQLPHRPPPFQSFPNQTISVPSRVTACSMPRAPQLPHSAPHANHTFLFHWRSKSDQAAAGVRVCSPTLNGGTLSWGRDVR